MKAPLIPPDWLNLHPGDMVYTAMPRDRIEAILKRMEPNYAFSLSPTPTGYMLTCEKSPRPMIWESSE
jgi:hypothetical protein